MPRVPVLVRAGALAAAVTAVAASLVTASLPAAAAAPATQPLHTVTVSGVQLDVPISWHIAGTEQPGCIVAKDVTVPAADRSYGVDDCQLRVLTGEQLGSLFHSPDRFFYGGPGNPAQCVRDDVDQGWVTSTADTALVGPAQAEFRRFTRACVSRPAEQWFLAGPPSVLIQRTSANPRTESAALSAVEEARIPARTVGYARSYTGEPESGSGRSVTLEPARLSYAADGDATASYVLDRSLSIDVSHAHIDYTDAAGNVSRLTPAQLVHDAQYGFPGLGAGNIAAVIAESRTGTQVDAITVAPAAGSR